MYCDHIAGIDIHSYGPHIFHTNNKYIWDYVNNLCEFKPFVYSPLAVIKGNCTIFLSICIHFMNYGELRLP